MLFGDLKNSFRALLWSYFRKDNKQADDVASSACRLVNVKNACFSILCKMNDAAQNRKDKLGYSLSSMMTGFRFTWIPPTAFMVYNY